MGWLRMEGGCGVSHSGEVGWLLTGVSGVKPRSTGRGVGKGMVRDGVSLLRCLDGSGLLRGSGNGVLMNNCSHTDGLNIPAIGMTLAISSFKLFSVMAVETSNKDMATCPAASIVPTTVRSGGVSVATDNCEGESVIGVSIAFKSLNFACNKVLIMNNVASPLPFSNESIDFRNRKTTFSNSVLLCCSNSAESS